MTKLRRSLFAAFAVAALAASLIAGPAHAHAPAAEIVLATVR
ncbi:hypothetical protein [Sciscionella marina]|nr:hypothetical protein [Sciscionella marina]